jgi:predicted phosphodiesterase
MPHLHDRRILAAIAVAACAAVALAGLALPALLESVEVEGGSILAQASDSITVRCLGPEVSLSLNGFEGRVTFTNCFPGSALTGHDGTEAREGTNITCTVDGPSADLRLSSEQAEAFSFAVMGDSQGRNDILAEALEEAGGCDFVIHCGDTTPSGQASEYDAFESVLRAAPMPVMVTPGNHDIKLDGAEEFSSRFGPTAFSFDYSGTRFAFVDSSDQAISEEEIDWLRGTFEGADREVLVTHMPSHDPFGDDHTLDEASCERVRLFALQEGVDAVITGHIHAYNLTSEGGTDYLISGGAGGILVDGVHHIVIVTVDEAGLSYEKVDLDYVPPIYPHVQVVGRSGLSLNLTYEELMAMDRLEGYSSYENLYGNIAGQGHYSGVPVRALLDLVGGMSEDDILTVAAADGYFQEFGYLNAYPDAAWLDLQGEMIVSLEMDSVLAPTWTEGPRVAMLPGDGLYSNSDCEATSYAGQGYYLYESAGARWVKNALVISVEAPA